MQKYPLAWPAGWPRARDRKDGRFNKTTQSYNAAGGFHVTSKSNLSVYDGVKRVLYELQRLDVPEGEAIISTNLVLRLDGLPRSDQAAPQDPGVAVYWRRRGDRETKVMAIDRYGKVADNLAAIAATLEAMRAIERHGGAQILERAFTGFDALPAPIDAWTILGVDRGASRDEINAAFRSKAAKVHPDAGGTHAAMAELTAARTRALESAPC